MVGFETGAERPPQPPGTSVLLTDIGELYTGDLDRPNIPDAALVITGGHVAWL
jgi:hypothetical protein